MKAISYSTLMLLLALLAGNPANAGQRIAILNFELNDMTALPNTPQEQVRTASMQPLLEQAMQKVGDYEIIQIDANAQAAANASFGYLFRFDDLAARLGKQFGADWVIVAQHSKPSFLYSYLLAHLVAVNTPALRTNFAIELKGNHEKVTQHGINALARKINLFTSNGPYYDH
jgi:hypothetical protein